MIRNYRDIGKPASILMYTGAGKSQDNGGGEVIIESFLRDSMKISINGSGWIPNVEVSNFGENERVR